MNKKNKILGLVIFVLFFVVFFGIVFKEKSEKQKISEHNSKEVINENYKIGLITDIHSESSKKDKFGIDDSVKRFFDFIVPYYNKKFHPEILIENGDFIEGTDREGQQSIDDFKKAKEYIDKINAPILHVFGNHESRGFSKDDWLKLTGYEKLYYTFDLRDLRIIVLDGNEEVEESEKEEGNFYFMSQKQIDWLEKTLLESENFKYKLVFIHYPVSEAQIEISNKNIAPKSRKILNELFEKYKVDAVFSGHTEALEFSNVTDVDYFILPGIEKSKRKKVQWFDCFYEIYVGENIKVKMFYKKNRDQKDYQTLIIPSEEFDKIEK